jgi:hypothetical protein
MEKMREMKACMRGQKASVSISSLSLNSSTLHRRLVAFLVRLAGGGEAVGEGCGNGDGGAGGEDGAGSAGVGGGARFIGRGSQVASSAAFGGVLVLTGLVETRLRRRRRRRRRLTGGATRATEVWESEQVRVTSCCPAA